MSCAMQANAFFCEYLQRYAVYFTSLETYLTNVNAVNQWNIYWHSVCFTKSISIPFFLQQQNKCFAVECRHTERKTVNRQDADGCRALEWKDEAKYKFRFPHTHEICMFVQIVCNGKSIYYVHNVLSEFFPFFVLFGFVFIRHGVWIWRIMP